MFAGVSFEIFLSQLITNRKINLYTVYGQYIFNAYLINAVNEQDQHEKCCIFAVSFTWNQLWIEYDAQRTFYDIDAGNFRATFRMVVNFVCFKFAPAPSFVIFVFIVWQRVINFWYDTVFGFEFHEKSPVLTDFPNRKPCVCVYDQYLYWSMWDFFFQVGAKNKCTIIYYAK